MTSAPGDEPSGGNSSRLIRSTCAMIVRLVEEGWRSYGVGSEIVSRIYEEAFDYVDAPIQRVAQKEVPLPYNATLEQAALPQVADVIRAVKEVL